MHWQQSASIIPLFIGNMICNFFWFYFKWKSTIMIVLEMPVGCFVKWTLNGLGSFEVVEALSNWLFWYIMRILLNYHYIWILLGPQFQYFHFKIIFDEFVWNYWWRYLSFEFSFNKYLTIHSIFLFCFKIELLSPHCLFLCCVFHLNWELWLMKFKIGLKCISTPYQYVAILKQSNLFQVEMDY